jgi:cobalt-precorrin 5A hydrolase
VANLLGGNPVITTASDVSGHIEVDTLAMKLNCKIEDFIEATKVTAHIVNEERVGIKSQIPIDLYLPKNLEVQKDKVDNSLKGLILITNEEEINKPIEDTVVLRPKNLVVGIGCRRNKEYEKIYEALLKSFKDLNLSTKSIRHFATIDIKKDEVGIKKLADKFERPLKIVTREEVKGIENKFMGSEFVKKTIGVGCVCEPVAFFTSIKGDFIQRKRAFDGITIAIFKEGDKNWM